MIIARDFKAFPSPRFSRTVLTMGVFDGVHLGHREVLSRVRLAARKIGGTAAVLTFQEHPQNVLKPHASKFLLTSFTHKLTLLEAEGMDLCLVPHFNVRFSKMSPEAFVEKILVRKLKIRKLILGDDSRFGHRRQGDVSRMADLAARFGFDFEAVPARKEKMFTVKSTLIRELLAEGELEAARKFLGRPYSVAARIVRGEGRGRELGFPTANLDLENEILPPMGVYAVRARLIDSRILPERPGFFVMKHAHLPERWPAVLNWGKKPTFRCNIREAVAEVHLLGFRGNVYGKMLEIEFLKMLRRERKFACAEDLKRQIFADIRRAERVFLQKSEV
ncbi:MAG TPA: riboflavin biosynthesis protein RibF [Candidatus Omnitrophota bacterium]|nr:riboflavin biosynthesis protein RibF [Candidatus Omnitrophota bacterium]